MTGATHTHSGLVKSALRLETGKPVDANTLFEARRRLYETGVFRGVDVHTEPAGDPVPSDAPGVLEQPMLAHVALEEWPVWRMRYGLQVNNSLTPSGDQREVGPGLAGDIERSNLFGRAARLGAAVRDEQHRQAVRGYFSTPRLFSLPITSTLFAQQEWQHVADADYRTTNVTFDQRYRLGRTILVSYGNFYRHTGIDTVVDILGQPFPIELIVNYAGLYSAVSFDRRDDPFNARRGWFHSSSLDTRRGRSGPTCGSSSG